MRSRVNVPAIILMIFFGLSAAAYADVSLKDAIKIGKDSLQQMMDQSHHFRVEYDTIVALPVHSKTIWKGDFYLLYFIKQNVFQVEMEVDKATGEPTVLAIGKMAQPYHELVDGTFNYKYFSVDSMMDHGFRRMRINPDSVRLDFFGVIPKLGKRGVVWEIFSPKGIEYISLGGPSLTYDQLITDMNVSQDQQGNYTADSIRAEDLIEEIERFQAMTPEEQQKLKMNDDDVHMMIKKYRGELDDIYVKFPGLRKRVYVKEKK